MQQPSLRPSCSIRPRHLSLKVAQEIASTRGGECLSTTYHNNRRHLKWRCSKGHEWKASLTGVKDRGTWCSCCSHEARRHPLKVAQDIAVARGGLCLSRVYRNNWKHLQWRCDKGHEWNASLNNVKDRGTWCRHCAIARRCLCLKVAKDVASRRCGSCLSTKYVNARKHLRWRCGKGHEWSASLSSIKDSGTWCPHCAYESLRLPLKVAQDVAKARGGVCLSTRYVNTRSHLKWKCGEGHEWKASLTSVKDAGSWCPDCAVQGQRLSLKVAHDLAASRGGLCLSTTYINSQVHLKWRCREGHEWHARLSSVKNRLTWCPQCAMKRKRLSLKIAQDTAASRGGTCLSTKYINNWQHLKWRCAEGHGWLASLKNVKDRGSWCPECSTGKSEAKVWCLAQVYKSGISTPQYKPRIAPLSTSVYAEIEIQKIQSKPRLCYSSGRENKMATDSNVVNRSWLTVSLHITVRLAEMCESGALRSDTSCNRSFSLAIPFPNVVRDFSD